MKAIKRYICVLFTIFIVYIVYRSLLLLLIKNDPNGYFNIWFRDHCSTTILSNDLQKNFIGDNSNSSSSKWWLFIPITLVIGAISGAIYYKYKKRR